MATDDKIRPGFEADVDHNVNTRDQKRVGVWFLVITALAVIGLMTMGGAHAPGEHKAQTAAEPHDMSGTSGQAVGGVNAGGTPGAHEGGHGAGFSINRPEGFLAWPGHSEEESKYLTGPGNTPADEAAGATKTPGAAATGAAEGAKSSGNTAPVAGH